MKIVYIIFFGILNFLFFSLLTKKVKINFQLTLGFIISLITIILFHFINPYNFSITNELFLMLFGFSLGSIIFHLGGSTIISIHKNKENLTNNKNIIKLVEVLFFQAIYILIYYLQISTIIKTGINH